LSVAQICSIIPDHSREMLYTGSVFFIQENGHVAVAMDRHIQYLYSPHRLAKIMKAIGFQEIEMFDGYTFREFDPQSTRALVVATKNSQKSSSTKSTKSMKRSDPEKQSILIAQEQNNLTISYE
jgi:hypothetical protein